MKTCWFIHALCGETDNYLSFWNEAEAMAFYEKTKSNPKCSVVVFMASHEDGTTDVIDC